mmetsp:Transcript_12329/g.12734  ORF Transcript_12329/g.12734 Transcript_12329/m.12734 type:complete len:212 (-) Transcript_12329:453-1088(-)
MSNIMSHKNSLPPKPPPNNNNNNNNSYKNGSSGRNNIQSMDHGDSLDRMMKKSNNNNGIPGLESHYSRSDRNSSSSYSENYPPDSSYSNSSSIHPKAARTMAATEYAEELRKQIQMKKDIDLEAERGNRRAYSNDYGNSGVGNIGYQNNSQISSHHKGGYKASTPEFSNRRSEESNNPRSQIKAYSAPEPTRRGRGNVPPGGHSTFSMKWE